jgi:uncharacterized protein (TIRG00374 family)
VSSRTDSSGQQLDRAAGPGRRWLLASWATGLVLLLGLWLLVSHLGEERQFAKLAARTSRAWLIAGALLQALTYVCAASVWQRALASFGRPLPLRGLIPLGLAKLFTDQALPSAGLSGTLLVVLALGRRGVPRGLALGAMMVGMVGFYLAYASCVAIALLILWSRGELHPVLLVLAALFGAVAAAVPLVVIWIREHTGVRILRRLDRLRVSQQLLGALRETPAQTFRKPWLLAQSAALQLGIFLLDAATLGVMLWAIGAPADPTAVFVSFVLASVVSTLAFVPGGLGVFEGSSVGMLHYFGVPLDVAFAATLLQRGFTFWLPMVPGLALARREMRFGARRER